jgi:hypothetical protein
MRDSLWSGLLLIVLAGPVGLDPVLDRTELDEYVPRESNALAAGDQIA